MANRLLYGGMLRVTKLTAAANSGNRLADNVTFRAQPTTLIGALLERARVPLARGALSIRIDREYKPVGSEAWQEAKFTAGQIRYAEANTTSERLRLIQAAIRDMATRSMPGLRQDFISALRKPTYPEGTQEHALLQVLRVESERLREELIKVPRRAPVYRSPIPAYAPVRR